MWETWNVRSRELFIMPSLLHLGGRAGFVLYSGLVLMMQPPPVVVLLLQPLQFLLLAVVFVVRNPHHAEEAGLPQLPGDEGL